MRIQRPSNEHEVVLAWLKAEFDSPRFKQMLVEALENNKTSLNLIMNPDLSDAEENQSRLGLLKKYRRWLDDDLSDYIWSLAELNKSDVKKLKYIDYSYWNELSDDTRLVGVAAKNILKGKVVFGVGNEGYFEVAATLDRGQQVEPIIALGESLDSLELLEGHVRATAFLLTESPISHIKAIVGARKPS